MNLFNKYQQEAQLSPQEIKKLDQKVFKVVTKGAEFQFGNIFRLPVFYKIFSIAMVIVLVLVITTNNADKLISKVTAETVLNKAITTLTQLRQNANLLHYQYKETVSSSVLDGYNVNLVDYNLDLANKRSITTRTESRELGKSKRITQSDGTIVTQDFPNNYYVTRLAQNSKLGYQYSDYNQSDLTADDFGFKPVLNKIDYPSSYFLKLVNDPVISQQKMLEYIKSNSKLSELKEVTLTINGLDKKAYLISVNYKYSGFLSNNVIQDFDYQADIYFDQENYLPIKIIDQRVNAEQKETFTTEFLAIEYKTIDEKMLNDLFAIDQTKFRIEEGTFDLTTDNKIVTLEGKLSNENIGEIYHLPMLTSSNDNKKYQLEGELFYNWEIAKPSSLYRFIAQENVILTGMILTPKAGSGNNILIVEEFEVKKL